MATRLLVLACSARKRDVPGLLPAAERYDGPTFRALRASLKTAADPPVVLVVSARPIPAYDRPLTPARADRLRPGVLAAFAATVAAARPAEIAVCLGTVYRRALAGWEAALPPGIPATVLGGGLGVRLKALKAWLHRG